MSREKLTYLIEEKKRKYKDFVGKMNAQEFEAEKASVLSALDAEIDAYEKLCRYNIEIESHVVVLTDLQNNLLNNELEKKMKKFGIKGPYLHLANWTWKARDREILIELDEEETHLIIKIRDLEEKRLKRKNNLRINL